MRLGVIHNRFILRQLTRSGGQPLVFILCVMLSIQSLVALDGFSGSIRRSMLQDARSLHAADIIIRSNAPLSRPVRAAVTALENRDAVKSVTVYEFYSMVRANDRAGALLAALKVVGAQYPFYGKITLASGNAFESVLAPGGIVVEQGLLDRLNLRVGDPLAVGDRQLIILDVVLSEPDRPVNFLSFGPRVFVSLEDAESLHLMIPGSRIAYKRLLKVSAGESFEKIATALAQTVSDGEERVETFQSARSRIKRFFDNFFFFLTLIAIFTLLLAGFGIRCTLRAFIRDKAHTIAVMKALGATSRVVRTNLMAVISLMGLAGTVLGIAAGLGIEYLLPFFLGPLLPATFTVSFSGYAIIKGLVLGLIVTLLFTLTPLERLKSIAPIAVFRKESSLAPNSARGHLTTVLLFALFSGLILLELKDAYIGSRFIAILTGLIVFASLCARGLLTILKHAVPRRLPLRLALRGLFRPGAAPLSISVTLSVSLGIVFAMFLVERNLDRAFIRAYPKDAPNLFFINIQPDQAEAFTRELGVPALFYPVIRARLVSINGKKINRTREKKRKGDNLSRPFNLTYRDSLLEDESLKTGNTLFQDNSDTLQVSILDTVAEMRPMRIGDKLVFNIQGLPVAATVSSIRTRPRESIKPFFYFVFPEDPRIKAAPQSIFTALRLPEGELSQIQYRMTSRFPNVSAIDVTQTLSTFSRIAGRFVIILRFFTGFSIGAGLLIIISAILATRWDRIQEAAYVKLLGAKSRFVLLVCTLEQLIIGLLSAFLALVISQSGSYVVCRFAFEIPFHPYPVESLFLIAATLIIVVIVGVLASIPVVRQKPIGYLQNETGG